MVDIIPFETVTIDGRKISYRKIGRGRRRLLFFHGFPGSSVQVELFVPCLEELDLTVIAIDRPGYNETSPAQDSQLRQSAFDVEALARLEGWDKFEVFCVSGGCPSAFFLVENLPQLVTKFFVVSGLGPIFRTDFKRFIPRLSRFVLWASRFFPESFFSKMGHRHQESQRSEVLEVFFKLSPADLQCMSDRRVQAVMSEAMREAFKQRGLGPKADARSYLESWPANLQAFSGPIEIWHGREDRILPSEMSVAFASILPGSQLRQLDGEGHFSLSMLHVSKILGRR